MTSRFLTTSGFVDFEIYESWEELQREATKAEAEIVCFIYKNGREEPIRFIDTKVKTPFSPSKLGQIFNANVVTAKQLLFEMLAKAKQAKTLQDMGKIHEAAKRFGYYNITDFGLQAESGHVEPYNSESYIDKVVFTYGDETAYLGFVMPEPPNPYANEIVECQD